MTMLSAVARAGALAALGALALAAAPGRAASLQLSPVSLTLAPHQNADGLWLSNSGSEPLQAQVRAYRWTQVDGEDRLEPTRDLVISPPMLQIGPGERQLVRVIRLGAPPESTEASYRVIVDELPVAVAAGTPARSGIDFVLRYSVPIFLRPRSDTAHPAQAPSPVLLRAAVVEGSDGTRLRLDNRGDGRAQIADLVFVDATGKRVPLRPGLAGYVLPGAYKHWPLAFPDAARAARLGVFKARINGTDTESVLEPAGTASPAADGPR